MTKKSFTKYVGRDHDGASYECARCMQVVFDVDAAIDHECPQVRKPRRSWAPIAWLLIVAVLGFASGYCYSQWMKPEIRIGVWAGPNPFHGMRVGVPLKPNP